jgi:hypothetical protein
MLLTIFYYDGISGCYSRHLLYPNTAAVVFYLRPSSSISLTAASRTSCSSLELHIKVRKRTPFLFLAPKAPNIVAVVCLVRHPPLAVGALVGHPSHLLVAQIGFAVLRAPRRTWPRPNPWPLAQDRVRRRISGEVRRCCSVAVRHSHTTLAT